MRWWEAKRGCPRIKKQWEAAHYWGSLLGAVLGNKLDPYFMAASVGRPLLYSPVALSAY
jgi:hypothetical protein